MQLMVAFVFVINIMNFAVGVIDRDYLMLVISLFGTIFSILAGVIDYDLWGEK